MPAKTAMCVRIAVLLGLAAYFAPPTLARPAKDVLVMKNGDRITCEVKSLQAGTLKVNLDYVDGTISIDWLKVARLESKYLFIVTLQDGSIYLAKLNAPSTAEGDTVKMAIQPENEAQPRMIDRSTVVSIAQTSESLLKRFSGNVTIGATYSKGNNATQYNFSSYLGYDRARWGSTVRYNSNLSSSTGATTTTMNQLDFGANHMLSRTNYFVGAIASFLQSSVQGIDRQNTVGVGVGRYLKNTNRISWWILGGAGWQGTKYSESAANGPSQNVAVGVISTNLQAFVFKKTRFDITSTAFPALKPEPGRLFYRANASYYVKLLRKIDWNLSFYGSWDTHPPPSFSGSDYGSSTGISWTFGNR